MQIELRNQGLIIRKGRYACFWMCAGGRGGLALQPDVLQRLRDAGRHDVHRQHPQPVRHQYRQVRVLVRKRIRPLLTCRRDRG